MKISRTSFFSLSLMVALASSMAVVPEAMAQARVLTEGPSLGDMAGNVTTSLNGVSLLGEAIAYVAGFFMGLGALFKFKAYRDNPQQTPLGTPITWLAIAIFLIALPTVFGTGFTTLFGQAATTVDPW